MLMSPRCLVPTFKRLMITALASAAIAVAGCGGDNPSSLAGTIELSPKKPSPPPAAKSPANNKANARRSNR